MIPRKTPDIPAEKAAVVQKLRIMSADGFKELQSMSFADLDTLEREVRDADIPNLDRKDAHVHTIKSALLAIEQRRRALELEQKSRNREQDYRLTHIQNAANLIGEAAREIDLAHRIAKDPDASVNKIPEPFKAIDAPALTDSQLADVVQQCNTVFRYGNRLDWSDPIARLNTPGAKDIAAELKEDEGAILSLLKSARGNIDAAQRELDERAREKAAIAAQDAEIMANLPNIIRELRDTVQAGAKR